MDRISTANDGSRAGRGFSAGWSRRWFWPAPRPARTGHRYRDLAVETHNSHWLVVAIYRADGGAEHAVLHAVRDGSVRRTLAVRVLEDPRRFRRVV